MNKIQKKIDLLKSKNKNDNTLISLDNKFKNFISSLKSINSIIDYLDIDEYMLQSSEHSIISNKTYLKTISLNNIFNGYNTKEGDANLIEKLAYYIDINDSEIEKSISLIKQLIVGITNNDTKLTNAIKKKSDINIELETLSNVFENLKLDIKFINLSLLSNLGINITKIKKLLIAILTDFYNKDLLLKNEDKILNFTKENYDNLDILSILEQLKELIISLGLKNTTYYGDFYNDYHLYNEVKTDLEGYETINMNLFTFDNDTTNTIGNDLLKIKEEKTVLFNRLKDFLDTRKNASLFNLDDYNTLLIELRKDIFKLHIELDSFISIIEKNETEKSTGFLNFDLLKSYLNKISLLSRSFKEKDLIRESNYIEKIIYKKFIILFEKLEEIYLKTDDNSELDKFKDLSDKIFYLRNSLNSLKDIKEKK